MRDALGLGLTPREGKVPDSPAQARLRSEGRDKEADALARDDYAVTILSPSEQFEAWGSPELAAPPGSPDGTPVPLPPPKSEAARQARKPVEGGPASDEAPAGEEAAQALRVAAAEGKRLVAEARARGDASPETIRAGMRLAEKIARGLQRLNGG
jgi:hypothetical protein